MSAGKWMFGATSQADLSSAPEKKTFFNRDMPESYTEGGLQIGENRENASNSRKSSAATYKAQLDYDKQSFVPSNESLPNARKKSAYDFTARKEMGTEDHPLGRSSMKALGAPATFIHPDENKAAQAAKKRSEMAKDRFDIITTLSKATDPSNTPGARMRQQLLIGQPVPGSTDDGALIIGESEDSTKEMKKSKQRAYFQQLAADQESSYSVPNSARGSAPNSARGKSTSNRDYNSMYTSDSSTRIETTGNTGFQIGSGLSRDMSGSMKDLAFDAKRTAQAKYREQLLVQQQENAYHKSVKLQQDHEVSNDDALPYLQ